MTYSQEVINALKDLVSHWELIIKGKRGEKNIINNLLCRIFLKTSCVGCPIFQKTSFEACLKTPYTDWLEHHDEFHHFSYPRRLRCEKCRELAQRELNFLKNLLKEIKLIKDGLIAT
jgi:hypothetical protein